MDNNVISPHSPLLDKDSYWVSYQKDMILLHLPSRATLRNVSILDSFVRKINKVLDPHIDHFPIFLDFEVCEYIDSTFMGMLTILDREIFAKFQDHLNCFHVQGFVLEAFHSMSLDKIFSLNKVDLPEDISPNSWTKVDIEDKQQELNILLYLSHKALSNVSESNKKEFHHAVCQLEKEVGREKICNLDKLEHFF